MIKITPTAKHKLDLLKAQMRFRTLSDTVDFLLNARVNNEVYNKEDIMNLCEDYPGLLSLIAKDFGITANYLVEMLDKRMLVNKSYVDALLEKHKKEQNEKTL